MYLLEDINERADREKVLNWRNEISREVDEYAQLLLDKGTKFLEESKDVQKCVVIAGYMKEMCQVMARRDFEKFLIAVEWNYPAEMKFYDIRKNVLEEWVKYLESLEYGELMGLSISAPPRTGKTTVRRKIFCVVYVKASREE